MNLLDLAKTFSPELRNDPAAKPVLLALEAAKWRKARDAAKLLVKKNKPFYTPLLVEANLGLFREMLQKQLFAEAKVLLEYIKTILPPTETESLSILLSTEESKLAGSSQPASETKQNTTPSLLFFWKEALKLAQNPSLSPSVFQIEAIDSLVVCFQPDFLSSLSAKDDSPLSASLLQEIFSIQSACDAAAEFRWDDMTSSLRSIPSSSPFRHWRFFLRGMKHWFAYEFSDASACFSRIPKGGACAVAAHALFENIYRSPCSYAHSASLHLVRIHWNLALTGYSPSWASTIQTTSQLWNSSQFSRTLEILWNHFGIDLASDWNGLLSCLRHSVCHGKADFVPTHLQKKASSLTNEEKKAVTFLTLEKFLRYTFHSDTTSSLDDMIAVFSETIIPSLLSFYEDDPILLSFAWLEAAKSLIKVSSPYSSPNTDSAILSFLANSSTAWEDNYECLILAARYAKSKKILNVWEQVMDDMLAQFPNDKWTLLESKKVAEQRNQIDQSISLLKKAIEIDPLDTNLSIDLVFAYAKKILGNPFVSPEESPEWSEITKLWQKTSGKSGILHENWTLQLLLLLLGSPSNAELENLKKLSPSPLEFNFTLAYFAEILDKTLPSSLLKSHKLSGKNFWNNASYKELTRILHLFSPLFQNEPPFHISRLLSSNAFSFFDSYLCRNFFEKKKIASDPKGAFLFICHLDDFAESGSSDAEGMVEEWFCNFTDTCENFSLTSKQYGNPYFSYLYTRFTYSFRSKRLDLHYIDDATKIAQTYHDSKLIAKLETLKNVVENLTPDSEYHGSADEDFDDDEFDGPFPPLPSDFPSEKAIELLEELLKKSDPAMIDMLKNFGKAPKKPKPTKAPAKPKKTAKKTPVK